HEQCAIRTRRRRPAPHQRVGAFRKPRIETEIIRYSFAAALLHEGGYAQRLSVQTNPRLELHRRLPLLADVPARQQTSRLFLDSPDDDGPGNAPAWIGSPVRAQAEQTFLRCGEYVIDCGVQGCQIAPAYLPGEGTSQTCALPVEHMD